MNRIRMIALLVALCVLVASVSMAGAESLELNEQLSGDALQIEMPEDDEAPALEISDDFDLGVLDDAGENWFDLDGVELEEVGLEDFSEAADLSGETVSENTSNPEDFEIVDGVLKKYKGDGGDVVIPDSVMSIGESAFYNCTSLKSISIPESVTSIGNYAFYRCFRLTSVIIPNRVTSVGDYAFSECGSLTSVSIPDSVTSIGECAFSSCDSLTSVSIPDSVTSIEYATFSKCGSLTSVSIPHSVTSIGHLAFNNCTSLTSVSIPDSVTKIGDSAFFCCTSLISVIIPESVTSIDYFTFSYCESLTSVSIPNSVTRIENTAFDYCSANLTIYGEAGSYAETYAKQRNIPFSTDQMLTPEPVIQMPDLIANAITLGVGEEIQIIAKDSPVKALDCELSSTNKSVATVREDGCVKAVGKGSANIRATVSGVSVLCKVTVLKAPTSITLSKKELKLGKGEIFVLTAKFPAGTGGGLTWTSSSNKVSVGMDIGALGWNLCSVMGKNKTTSRVTIKARTYNGLEATCSVRVLSSPKFLWINNEKLTMSVGESYTLQTIISPYSYANLAWSSSKKDIVSVDANGKLKALKKGKAKIKAKTYNGLTVKCTVEVKAKPTSIKLDKKILKMRPYDTYVLTPTLSKNSGAVIKWKSSNNSVATVDENGMVTSLKGGSATITAYTWNKKKAECKVEVAPNSDVKYRALLIGQEKTYKDGDEWNFRKDVEAMNSVLKAVKGPSGGKWSVKSEYDVGGTKSVLTLIKDTFSGATKDDVSLIFISCHGNKYDGGLLLTDKSKEVILPLNDLAEFLNMVPGKVVVILASCGSGAGIYPNGAVHGNAKDIGQTARVFNQAVVDAFASVDSGLYVDAQGYVVEAGEQRSNRGEMRKVNKFYVLTSCNMGEEGYFKTAKKKTFTKPSFFVQSISDGVKKLSMPADVNKDKIITLQELYDYTYRVTSEKAEKENKEQHVQVYPKNCEFGLFKRK